MKSLKTRLDALCVLRDLLHDPVLRKLSDYLECPTVSGYAAFVGELYSANGGDLGLHLKDLCENSENVYVRLMGEGKDIPGYLHAALEEELKLMQELAELTPVKLRSLLSYGGFLPDFANSPVDLPGDYLCRTADIGRYGYGIYAKNPMFYVDENGAIVPVRHPDQTKLSDLVDYERERSLILQNTRALLAGKPAANILLTGDAGTGKSSTVKAVGNALFSEGLRIIELRKDQLRAIPVLLNELSRNPLKFVLFLDDLSFLKDDDSFNALKAVLEGSVSAKSSNVVIYATGNRRHIIKEKFSDRDGDDVHRNDTLQELISLSERFGLHITFSRPNRATYLHIVRHLAQEAHIDLPTAELEAGAERLALERGGRSARLARQYIDSILAGRISSPLG